jgi:hypothetical protein
MRVTMRTEDMKSMITQTRGATRTKCTSTTVRRRLFPLLLVSSATLGCAGSFPEPTQRLADAQSAERSARELGAEDEPKAQLSLQLAQNQIAQAEKAIAEREHEQADSLLIRAQADAELAMAQTREADARASREGAVQDSAKQRNMNEGQGAVQ